jgi:hypothetical protein
MRRVERLRILVDRVWQYNRDRLDCEEVTSQAK